jgi:predicted dehydrogenase
MSENKVPEGMLATGEPDLFFEDNTVGRLKKEVWDSSDQEIDALLAEYGIPSPVEWGKPGSYIQTTVRIHRDLPLNFFMERYTQAYVNEIKAFVDCVLNDTPPPVSGLDGRIPVVMGLAAAKSLAEGRPVRLEEIG